MQKIEIFFLLSHCESCSGNFMFFHNSFEFISVSSSIKYSFECFFSLVGNFPREKFKFLMNNTLFRMSKTIRIAGNLFKIVKYLNIEIRKLFSK